MIRKDLLTLAERVKQAQKELDDLKNKQPIRGDSWVVHRSQTDDTWDLQVDNVASNYSQLFKVTLDVEDPSNGFMIQVNEWDELNGITFVSFPDYDDPFSHYFLVYSAFGWSATNHLYMKFYCFSPQSGIITVTQLCFISTKKQLSEATYVIRHNEQGWR